MGIMLGFAEFPFLLGWTFIEAGRHVNQCERTPQFPFLLGGTFIEACLSVASPSVRVHRNFPSFWEGLSLRPKNYAPIPVDPEFPFLLGGTFIEATKTNPAAKCRAAYFPSFWEGLSLRLCIARAACVWKSRNFPSFWEGLSLRRFGFFVMEVVTSAFPFLLGGTFIEA